jgi:hypothetical protein
VQAVEKEKEKMRAERELALAMVDEPDEHIARCLVI